MKLGSHMTDEQLVRNSIIHMGIQRSPESRAKQSESTRGVSRMSPSAETRGKIAATLHGRTPSDACMSAARSFLAGRTFSVETREKLSAWQRGSLNHEWKGGITPEHTAIRNSDEYVAWRMTVLVRDEFVCQKCHGENQKLKVHHMDCFADFPEKRMDMNNGITLCRDCHIEFHHRYGVLHNRKWQTDEFLGGGQDD